MSLNSWRKMPFSEVVEINPKRSLRKGEIVPFIDMAALSTLGRKIRHVGQRVFEGAGSRFQTGDTLFARITPCAENGKIGFVDCLPTGISGAGSTEFVVFGPRGGVSDPEFVYHLARSEVIRGPALSRMIGTTGRKRVPNFVFQEIEVSLPPLPEQCRIAEILSSVDEAIQMTQSLVVQMGKVRLLLLDNLFHRGQWEENKSLPDGWRLVLLDQVARRASGHTPSKGRSEYWNGGIKWVSLQDTKRLDKLFIVDTTAEISDLGIKNSSAVLHPAGTVVLSRDATVGRSAVLASSMAVSQHFIAWICSPALDNIFLYYWLQHMKPVFERIGAGSTIKTIGLPFFKGLTIPLPPLEVQKRLGARMMEIDQAIQASKVELDQLLTLKLSLMSDLFTGRVRVRPNLPMAAE